MKHLALYLSILAMLIMAGCTASTARKAPPPTVGYVDHTSNKNSMTTGIESQDISALTDKMVRSILNNRALNSNETPPIVIVDSKYIRNQSSSRIDKSIITSIIFDDLMNSGGGKIMVMDESDLQMVREARKVKRSGEFTSNMGLTKQMYYGDYRITGRITSHDTANATGRAARYHMIHLRIVDLETGMPVWSGRHEFKKSSQTDILYR